MHPLDALTHAALAVLADFAPTADPEALAAAARAIKAGADPALVVVATGEGTPAVLVAMRHPDGLLVPIATVQCAPATLQ